MMTWYEWRDRMAERSRQRMVERLPKPKPLEETERRSLLLDTLREWGVIDEDQYQEGKRGLANIGLPQGRAWDLRAEVRARDRRDRPRQP